MTDGPGGSSRVVQALNARAIVVKEKRTVERMRGIAIIPPRSPPD
jgi:hypothetical protein